MQVHTSFQSVYNSQCGVAPQGGLSVFNHPDDDYFVGVSTGLSGRFVANSTDEWNVFIKQLNDEVRTDPESVEWHANAQLGEIEKSIKPYLKIKDELVAVRDLASKIIAERGQNNAGNPKNLKERQWDTSNGIKALPSDDPMQTQVYYPKK